MRNGWWHAGLIAVLCGVPTPAVAQAAAADTPATLTYVEGEVDLDHDGAAERAQPSALLFEGDRVRTLNGRAELVFGDGSTLHADQDTTLEWLGGSRLRLLGGRVVVRVAAVAPIIVDTAQGSARLESRGEYDVRLDQRHAGLELSVSRGLAELATDAERVSVRAGESAFVDSGARAALRPFNSARFDAFARWSYDRAYSTTSAASSRWLPQELRTYGPLLDQHGRWDQTPSYGYVWYPAVTAGWRPYSHGHWRYTRRGWTWFGADAWALPTHHYGRWGLSGASWFWIPAKGWGPAWVSWGFGSGLVSWSPLGWDGRPVVEFWARGGYHQPIDPWRVWTAVPRHRFGHRGSLQSWHVDVRRISEPDRRSFILQSAPPLGPGDRAVPRGTLPTSGAYTAPAPTGAVRRADERGIQSWERRDGRTANDGSGAHSSAGGVRRPRETPGPQRAPGPQQAPEPQSTTPFQGRSTTPTVLGPGAVSRNPQDDAQSSAPRRRAPWVEERTNRDATGAQAGQPAATPTQSWSAPAPSARGRQDPARAEQGAREAAPARAPEPVAVPGGARRNPERSRGGPPSPRSEAGGRSPGTPEASAPPPSSPGSSSERAVRRPR